MVGCVNVCTRYMWNVCGVRDACDITGCVMRRVYTRVCGMGVCDRCGVCVWCICVCVFVHDVVIYVLCIRVCCLCVIVVPVTGMSSVDTQCMYG